ncbi:MAG: hypothetical protein HN921_14865 [Bacteroidetes bacterium]|nr:hypothetical protein [Bacteroidota bacterium]
MKFKGIFISILTTLLMSNACLYAQHAQLIQKGGNLDPSFYDITKISDNEYWIGGEFGILNSMDTLGRITPIELPFECSHILRIVKRESDVYITTTDGQLINYNLISKIFKRSTYDQKYRKSCFYDMLILDDGTLYICGGASRIASGKVAYPNGFVLKTSVDKMDDIEVIWKNRNSFVWSMYYEQDKNNLLMSAYSIPLLNSSIYFSNDSGSTWKKEFIIKGIVHDFGQVGDEIWYCGSKNILYYKHGILGKLTRNSERIVIKDIGCIYDFFSYEEKLISCNYQGQFFEYNLNTHTTKDLDVINSYPIYSFQIIRPGKLLIVGHGNTIYLYNYLLEKNKKYSQK